ncbi:MAG: cobalamin-dependent protein [Myxococcales bacterium]|nr:cobalamin-dependent protein [Myxococcales bacterium]
MKVQLINPPVFQNPNALTALRPAPPLGLAYIAATLEGAGHTIDVIDAVALAPEKLFPQGKVVRRGLGPDEIIDRIDPAADVIGVGNMWSFSWPLVRELLGGIRKRFPDKAIVCGGEHFNGLSRLSMEQAPIDYIVRGEGEETTLELFAALESGKFDPATIQGIVWRRDGEIVMNEPRTRVKDIDKLSWPAWHFFDLDTYNAHSLVTGIDYGYMVPILATRGCPYSCTYCSSPRMWTTRWVPRDPVDVVDEIQTYVETYGANNFPMQDLTAIIQKDWILSYCNEILNRGLDIRWQFPSGTRCEVIDEEVAPLLWKSGCRSLCYAPESGSELTRKLIKKKMKKESLMSAVAASVKAKLNITIFIVCGFPHDTDATMMENVRFARELALAGVDDVALGFFFPIPNTELYDYLCEKGRMAPTDDNLLAPILATDRFVAPERNFCENIPAWKMTLYRYLILLNFYPLSFITRPGRVWSIITNVLRGKEASKIEVFLNTRVRTIKRQLGLTVKEPAKPTLPAGGVREPIRRKVKPTELPPTPPVKAA